MGRRVVVTGGAGSLGSHLCERLVADGSDVVCLDDPSTGAAGTVAHLRETGGFRLVRADVTIARPEDDPCFRQPDITLASTRLGGEPQIPATTGLARTTDWFRASCPGPLSGAGLARMRAAS
jgi:nucleoside-diphosphate-sugar epimerase